MGYELVQVDPHDYRDEIVHFFWERRHWPWDTLEEYYDAWDWRYRSLSDGHSWVWLARETQGQRIVGHIAVHSRKFKCGGEEIQAGVPGNLLVHHDHRGSLVGPRLVSFPRSLVKSGEVDLVIAFANPTAHGMFERLGFHDFGQMHPFVRVKRWRPVLARRLAVAAPLGQAIDYATAIGDRRREKGTSHGLTVRRLEPDQFLAFDRSHWETGTEGLSNADSGNFVIGRFLRCPYAKRQLIGVLDDDLGRLEGYVVAGGQGRVRIWDCQVNKARLDEISAIERAASELPDLETIVVPLLPHTALAGKLRAAGFRRRDPDDYMTPG